jgi:hypothetical protein
MPLPARLADFDTAIADLRACIANCDADVAANDPDSAAITHLREQCSGALGQLGFDDRSEQV